MTEIEKKALALVNEVTGLALAPPFNRDHPYGEALCRAIEELEAEKAARAAEREQHEAFRQDINDELLAWFGSCLPEDFTPFIIPKTDPLTGVIEEIEAWPPTPDQLRAAIEKRGLKIVEDK